MIQPDTLAFRTLLAVAHQRDGLDELRCRLVLELLSTSAPIRTALLRSMREFGLNELKLGALAVLFRLDPEPVAATDLAFHTAATRSAMTEVLDTLELRALVCRRRDPNDRRVIYVHLTEEGRALAERALIALLQHVGSIARAVPLQAAESLFATFGQLAEGARRVSSAP